MSAPKKNQRPHSKNPVQPVVAATLKNSAPQSTRWIFTLSAVIGILAFLLYSNTLNHEYVLDDFSVIRSNPVTQMGVDGLGEIFSSKFRTGTDESEEGLYRPLSRAMFAVEWQLAPDTPALSHWVNVLMYALTCAMMFFVLYRFFKTDYLLPLIATLLFTFHAVHTEVVANIKSRDEILSLFFLLLSLNALKSYLDRQKLQFLLVCGASFFLSMLSKESSITYLVIIPMTAYFFGNAGIRKTGTVAGMLLALTIGYMVIHNSVIGSIGISNVPVADNSLMASESFLEQRMTAIYILGKYFLLLLFPHPLSCDYSYNTIPNVTSAAHPGFLLSLLFHLFLVAVAVLQFRKKTVLSYSILFYIVTMSVASNLVVIIGTNMAERLLFVPSLGFTLAASYLLLRLLKVKERTFRDYGKIVKQAPAAWAIVGVVLLGMTIKTRERNADWRNISTLFNKDVKTVPNSTHMLLYHAGMITNSDSLASKTPLEKHNTLLLAKKELEKAIKIYEQFPNAHSTLANVYKDLNEFDLASTHYERAIALNDGQATVYNNYATVKFTLGKYQEAETLFKKAIDLSPVCYADALCNLGSVYGTYGELFKAEGKNQEAMQNFEAAVEMFKKTIACEEDYKNAHLFLASTYVNMGKPELAAPYQARYETLVKAPKK